VVESQHITFGLRSRQGSISMRHGKKDSKCTLKDWYPYKIGSEVVEPASKVDRVANGIQQEDNLVGGPANDESAANHQ